ncbi:DHH family phosphoesterase [Fervidibacillus halotolerans]|uniref:DHH family phosphoesterase n=1 Tax=Fervidibacillus halotolerans TaxID=2980027 RepID=UPI003B847F01
MPIFLRNKTMGTLIVLLTIFIGLFLGIFFFYNHWMGIIGFVIYVIIIGFIIKEYFKFKTSTKAYIQTLSYRINKVGEEAFLKMPIGIMLINDDYYIDWANPYLVSCFKEEKLVGRSLYDIGDHLIPMIKQELEEDIVPIDERIFHVYYKKEEKLFYFFDITKQVHLEKKYEEEKPVIAIVYLDNYDEVTQGMNDETRGSLNSRVTSLLNQWANEYGIYLKRISSDRFIAFFNERILRLLEDKKFHILDDVRETTMKNHISLTLSIGVGVGGSSLPELGTLAQSSLDLALGRGGDQVAMKLPNGKVKFYGGKTNPMEKRTRVRARVISHALAELIQESDRVFIMGHKHPDLDAIGASIGVLKISELNNTEAYVILDKKDVETGVQRLMKEVRERTEIYNRFISPEEALEMDIDNALLVIVDTHKPSFVIEEKLVERIERVVVIDHHRRSEEFVRNPLLVYMEPYASSTSELVTELLEYQPAREINIVEATALLAGIIVDTKSFTLRTGSRTFDAASFLRSKGADTVLVQKLLKEDVNTYLKRSRLIEKVQIYQNGIAITKGESESVYSQILIAQTADLLLTMENVEASFVIANLTDEVIGISARSLGNINVQIIMEQMEGGGHLTNAATQLNGLSIDEVEEKLLQVIDEYLEGGNE